MLTVTPKAIAYAEALKSIISGLNGDPGLKKSVTDVDMSYGISSARMLNKFLAIAIDKTGVNEDGIISKADIMAVSDAIQADATMLSSYTAYHGKDDGNESGFHLLRGDGAEQTFKGMNAADSVFDGIYHIGFAYSGDNLVDQGGNLSFTLSAVAGWLNYFLNDLSMVYGTNGDDYMTSGTYSTAFADAANEVFDAGVGNDQIYANDGDDLVHAGDGDDRSSGGFGRDTLNGGSGIDQLFGDAGNDKIYGEDGDDGLYGGLGIDVINGGDGNDSISGNESDDKLIGGSGNDSLNGGRGNDVVGGNEGDDTIFGDVGDDSLSGMDGDDAITGSDGDDVLDGGNGGDLLSGGLGDDSMTGGAGKDSLDGNDGIDLYRGGADGDLITMWDNDDARDIVVFETGDSGVVRSAIDVVNGFTSGQDVINLRSFGSRMSFEDLDFVGGHPSVYYDGHYLRIDRDGDRDADLIIQFNYVTTMVESDFLFA